jgi:hypothetical protein
MEDELYKKIGKQEMMIEALKKQNSEVSQLVAKFISGDEKPEDWSITPQGQLHKKSAAPDVKLAKK